MTTLDQQRYLKPVEVASILRLNPNTVYIWIRAGKIPAVKISKRKFLIDREALTKFMEQNGAN